MKALNIQAVIFDMDGLMLDTERLAQMAWRQSAALSGYSFSQDAFKSVIGRRMPDIENILLKTFGEGFPFSEVYHRKQQFMEEISLAHRIPVKPGLCELLDYLQERGFRRAIASSTSREGILRSLAGASVPASRFDVIVSGDEVAHGKPAPDIFLETAARLGLAPSDCMVLEDSNPGIRAAHAAGMLAVMVPDQLPPDAHSQQVAYQIVDSLNEVRSLLAC